MTSVDPGMKKLIFEMWFDTLEVHAIFRFPQGGKMPYQRPFRHDARFCSHRFAWPGWKGYCQLMAQFVLRFPVWRPASGLRGTGLNWLAFCELYKTLVLGHLCIAQSRKKATCHSNNYLHILSIGRIIWMHLTKGILQGRRAFRRWIVYCKHWWILIMGGLDVSFKN